MSLHAGTRLGPYELIAPIGKGGMGEVWRAHDPRLGRDVAVKVSAQQFSGRFEREARSIAALNHPNICTLHDIGPNYLVMELIEGAPLAGPLALGEALRLAVQIADALSVAHAKGVVHRDLKPANILVTASGIKLLDFGLALLKHDGQPAASEATVTISLTQAGTILGTAAYMSPEQAQAKPVDARSDIFSFGVVFYEMLSGRRAFTGDSPVAVLAAVLRDQPPSLEAPPAVQNIVTRCLCKAPADRFQSMTQVKDALLAAISGESSREVPASETGGTVRSPRFPAPRPRRFWLWGTVAAATLLLVNATLWFARMPTAPLPPQKLVPVTTYAGSERYPSFSPDGRQVAFYWDGEKGVNPGIYVKLLGDTNALRLTHGQDAFPVWSPDGSRIAFVRSARVETPTDGGNFAGQGIYTVSALGGAERKLLDIDTYDQISMSPDGKWLALARREPGDPSRGGTRFSAIFVLPLEGGEPRRVSSPREAFDMAPAFSPDGHRLAWAECHRFNQYSCDLYIQELGKDASPSGSPRQVTREAEEIYGITWGRDGRSLIYSAAHSIHTPYLWRVDADGRQSPRRLEVAGPMAFAPSVSSVANRLVFEKSVVDVDIWRWRAGAGMEPLIISSLRDFNPQYSPDGTRIAFCSDRAGEGTEIWIAQADGSGPVQLTNGLGRNQGSPQWSPDGRWIAFDSEGQDGQFQIYVIEPGGGSPRKITSEVWNSFMPFWGADGKWIYFLGTQAQIWRAPSGGGRGEQVTTQGGKAGHLSADGATIFYTKIANVRANAPLFARPLAGGEEHQILAGVNPRAFFPVADGIYYIAPQTDDGFYLLEFYQFSTKTSRVLEKISGLVDQGLSVSPDGKSMLFSRSVRTGSDLMMIENY
jgi:hypothetical protein